jgi:hypothetical protein
MKDEEIIDLTSSDDEKEDTSKIKNEIFKIKIVEHNQNSYITPEFNQITKKMNKINEKLFFFNESINSLQERYQNKFPAFIVDKNTKFLFGNNLFFESINKTYGLQPNQLLLNNTTKLLNNFQKSSATIDLFSKINSLMNSKATTFNYYIEKKHDSTGKFISVTICVNKITDPYTKNIIFEFIYFVKPLN